MRAIALLSMWKTRNSLRTLFTDPRKLIPTLIAVAYFGLMIFIAVISGGQRPLSGSPQSTVPLELFDGVLFLGFLLVAITVIDNGLGDNLLAFPPPDIDYVFPSPISRRVVLLYRLPALTLGASFLAGTFLFLYRFASRAVTPEIAHPGNVSSSPWMVVGATIFCVGTYMNLAMFMAIQFERRREIHRYLMGFLLLLASGIVLIAWYRGVSAVIAVAGSPWLRWPFLPSSLVAQTITHRLAHLSVAPQFFSLAGLYALSLVPMFSTNANFYEQSIVSSERVHALRRAARGGFASLMAQRASTAKYKAKRDYTVPPFGEGAEALFWAHLCAAWKRPFATFVTPVLAGAGMGVVGAAANGAQAGMGYAILGALVAYSGFGFMASAKTASEAAIRRRELTATLPIPGWQAVAANLGIPAASLLLLCLAVSIGYSVMRGPEWPLVACAVLVFFSLRMFARMLIVYMLVLAYPDLADKIQQFFGQMIYYLFGAPLFIGEVIVCIPAIFLRSFWIALATLIVYEAALSTALIFLAGKVSDRAIASGEPVRFWKLKSQIPRPSKGEGRGAG